MSEELTQAQSLYQRNIALEAPERNNLFEEMSNDFIGVFA